LKLQVNAPAIFRHSKIDQEFSKPCFGENLKMVQKKYKKGPLFNIQLNLKVNINNGTNKKGIVRIFLQKLRP
jgi:hypothetical protein